MKFWNKGSQWCKLKLAPHSPETELKCSPQVFLFDSVLPWLNTDTWWILADVIGCWAHELFAIFFNIVLYVYAVLCL